MPTETMTQAKIHPPYSIDRMLDPISPEEFFSEYYEKKPCRIHRKDASFYHHLLTLNTIDGLLSSQTLRFPKVRLVNSALAEQPKADSFTTNGADIHPSRFLKHYSEGCTMVFSSLQERIGNLGLFIDHMNQFFNHSFQTNIYLTPPNAQGFNPHYDTHDVFILQVAGSKLWRLFDTPIELPQKSQPFELNKVIPGPISDEFVLHAGDMLYIPRGLMHDAETTGELSMHITAGLLGLTWTDLMVEAILNMGVTDIELRKYMPIGYGSTDPTGRLEMKQKFDEILSRLSETHHMDESLNRFSEKLQSELQPNLPGQFHQISQLGNLTAQCMVRRRPEAWFRRSDSADKCHIHHFGQNIEFPDFTRPAIDHIEKNSVFRVNELPDCMDEKGKVVFAKRLIKEGLLIRVS